MIGSGPRRGTHDRLGSAGILQSNAVVAHCVGVTFCPVDFHVLAIVGPVPGGLDDALRFRISENDRRFVVDLGILVRLDLLRHGGDGEWAFIVHEPSEEVGSIATEVGEGTPAVEHGIGEPFEKLIVATDFDRTLVPIVHDNLSQIA